MTGTNFVLIWKSFGKTRVYRADTVVQIRLIINEVYETINSLKLQGYEEKAEKAKEGLTKASSLKMPGAARAILKDFVNEPGKSSPPDHEAFQVFELHRIQ